jgi:WD40 repeat protein
MDLANVRPISGGAGTAGADHRVLVWEISKAPSKAKLVVTNSIELEPFGEYFGGISLSPDGKSLIVGGKNVGVWDLAARQKTMTLAGGCGDFSSDGRKTATGGAELGTEGRVWDSQTGKELAKLRGGHDSEVSVVQWWSGTITMQRG